MREIRDPPGLFHRLNNKQKTSPTSSGQEGFAIITMCAHYPSNRWAYGMPFVEIIQPALNRTTRHVLLRSKLSFMKIYRNTKAQPREESGSSRKMRGISWWGLALYAFPIPQDWMSVLTIRKPMVEPNRMTDNFRGKAMTLVAGRWLFHAAQSAKPELN